MKSANYYKVVNGTSVYYTYGKSYWGDPRNKIKFHLCYKRERCIVHLDMNTEHLKDKNLLYSSSQWLQQRANGKTQKTS
jgi:hypothetical protein